MTWPDDGEPRFVIDLHPSVRILDRAYAHCVVRHYDSRGRPPLIHAPKATIVAARLNRLDRRGHYDRDITDVFPVGQPA